MATTQRPTIRRTASSGPAFGRMVCMALLLVAVAAGAVLGQEDLDDAAVDTAQEVQQQRQRTEQATRALYCGRNLVTVINMVCYMYGGSYSPVTRKRNNGRNPFRNWLNKRHQDGIVEQCCRRPCSAATMRRYCTFPNEQIEAAANQEVSSDATTTLPTTTAAPTTTTTSPASPQGSIYQLTTSTHDLIPIPNDDYFPVLYYRSNRAYESNPYY